MAAVACLSSLLLLYWLLDSWTGGGIFQAWGLGGISYGQIITSIYLKVGCLTSCQYHLPLCTIYHIPYTIHHTPYTIYHIPYTIH
ncbi:hypothetical protein EON63_04740, partial [archaeon]